MPRDGYLIVPEVMELASPRSFDSAALSAQELMATPDHMLAWLRSKPADAIVATDLGCTDKCLGGNFFKALHVGERFPYVYPWDWFAAAFDILLDCDRVTAAQAIEAIERARSEIGA